MSKNIPNHYLLNLECFSLALGLRRMEHWKSKNQSMENAHKIKGAGKKLAKNGDPKRMTSLYCMKEKLVCSLKSFPLVRFVSNPFFLVIVVFFGSSWFYLRSLNYFFLFLLQDALSRYRCYKPSGFSPSRQGNFVCPQDTKHQLPTQLVHKEDRSPLLFLSLPFLCLLSPFE